MARGRKPSIYKELVERDRADDVSACVDVFQCPDYALRQQIFVQFMVINRNMGVNRVQKQVVAVSNIFSDQHMDYVKRCLDTDVRPVLDKYGVRMIITKRAGYDNCLFITMTKYSRMSRNADDYAQETYVKTANMYF